MRNRFSFILCAFLSPAIASAQASSHISPIGPDGEFAVGRRQLYWIDSTRKDVTDSSRFREITGWVWYPAAGSADTEELPLPPAWQNLKIEVLRGRFGPEVASAMKSFAVRERTDAPVLAGRSQFPVLLFVPGLSWLASDYSVVIDDLVSHGYVVVGISPAGFSDPVVFPDGRIVHQSLGRGEKIGTDQSIAHDDALFSVRQIRRMNEAGSLRGRIDTQRIGAFGHSLGGTTALVAASRDTSIRAAINIDGDPMGSVREARPRQPLLLISSESPTIDEAPSNPSAEHMELVRQGLERSEKRRTDDWNAMSSQSVSARRVIIPGAHHLNFVDAALASRLLSDKTVRWMKFGTIEPEQALATLSSMVRTFFDQSLDHSH
jgi:dienelactone hydrolase